MKIKVEVPVRKNDCDSLNNQDGISRSSDCEIRQNGLRCY